MSELVLAHWKGGIGYQLPLGESVVGRDSVKDRKNAINKLRIGIPNSEEVSRYPVVHRIVHLISLCVHVYLAI